MGRIQKFACVFHSLDLFDLSRSQSALLLPFILCACRTDGKDEVICVLMPFRDCFVFPKGTVQVNAVEQFASVMLSVSEREPAISLP